MVYVKNKIFIFEAEFLSTNPKKEKMKVFKLFVAILLMTVSGVLSAQTMDDAIAKFNEGADDINKGEFSSAITSFNELLIMAETVGPEADNLVSQAKEQLPLLHYQVAIGYIKQKDYENAIPSLENTVALSDAYGNNEDKKEKALKYLPQLLTGVGTQDFKDDNFDKAIERFKSAIKYSPNYPKSWLGLGLVYQKQFNEEEMVSTLSKAIELGSQFNDTKTVSTAKEALASYYVDEANLEFEDMDPMDEDFSYLIELYEKALSFQPSNADANYKLALIYNRMIEYDLAIEHAKKALETEVVEIKVAAINFELGNAYIGTAEYDLACAAFDNAMVGVLEDKAMAKKEKYCN
jgi:tetratricopeptide (TPR) repeat protein